MVNRCNAPSLPAFQGIENQDPLIFVLVLVLSPKDGARARQKWVKMRLAACATGISHAAARFTCLAVAALNRESKPGQQLQSRLRLWNSWKIGMPTQCTTGTGTKSTRIRSCLESRNKTTSTGRSIVVSPTSWTRCSSLSTLVPSS